MNEKKARLLTDEELKEVTGGNDTTAQMVQSRGESGSSIGRNEIGTVTMMVCEQIKSKEECLKSSKCTWNNGQCETNTLQAIHVKS